MFLLVSKAGGAAAAQPEIVEKHLTDLRKSVNVLVSLVNLCRLHDKVNMHSMAVKYGGKFVDSFLKAFDYLEAHFQTHNDLIIKLLMEFQKGTRTIQTLCSEAKGMKQTAVASKIPATKRSMERFLFRVKALLLTTSTGRTCWIGNLKHKDLAGQVVSSQAYAEHQSNDVDDENDDMEMDGDRNEDEEVVAASEEEEVGEAEVEEPEAE
ncbi:unnamed protein product [Linum tenue]|uniref:Uncharacterized protein n=1 Tax=Linum tenue TaxID=586396 RepID=A0AAV0LZ63_9ROSI|nr:unnamed protein product [Linum tenue]